MKTCKKCLKEKELSEFRINKHKKGGRSHNCAECDREYCRSRNIELRKSCNKYEKTMSGFLMRLYRNMKSRVTGVQKTKLHLYEGKDLLTKEDFYNWSINNPELKKLWKQWIKSGYERRLTPSVDRVKPEFGYTLSNMEFVPFYVNCQRSHLTKRK